MTISTEHIQNRVWAPSPVRFSNHMETVVLIAVIGAIAMFVGYLVLGTIGALTLISTFGSTRVMDRWVLRAVDARPVGRREMPRVYRVLEELASRAEVPVPLLRVAPSDVPNAFTVGRSPENASIALTEGLLYSLDFRQLSGVIAHEVARIRGRDLLLQSYAAAVTRLLRSIWIVAPAGVRG